MPTDCVSRANLKALTERNRAKFATWDCRSF